MKTVMFRLIAAIALLMAMPAGAITNEAVEYCGTMNIESVDQVYACMVKITQPSPTASCHDVRRHISEARQRYQIKAGNWSVGMNIPTPSCDIMAKVLERFSGKTPAWTPCLGYDGSVAATSRCLAVKLGNLRFHKNQYYSGVLPCHLARSSLASGLEDAGHTLRSHDELPACGALDEALKVHGEHVAFIACTGYVPNSEAHITRCLSDYTVKQVPHAETCESLREVYKGRIISVSDKHPGTGLPAGYEAPGCQLFQPTLARLDSPAPAQVATPAQPSQPQQKYPPQQQSSPSPTVAAPATIPAPQQGYTPPAARAQATTAPSIPASATQEPRDQRRERKYNEKMAEARSGAETVNQAMGILGVGNGARSPEQQQNPAPVSPPPAGPETNTQRKTREAGEKVNDTAETVKAVKGMFDMFTK